MKNEKRKVKNTWLTTFILRGVFFTFHFSFFTYNPIAVVYLTSFITKKLLICETQLIVANLF
jgi:hypothetical protein